MGSYTLTVFALILSLASFFIYPSFGVSHETLGKICSRIEDKDFCERLLKSDPRTSSADLPKLSLISIELTKKQALKSQKTFSEFRDNTTTNHDLKNAFNNCVELYKKIQANIDVAYQLSQKRQYRKITQLTISQRLAFQCGRINIVASTGEWLVCISNGVYISAVYISVYREQKV
jgi:pectinesterase inhibitor-like protein